MKKFLTVLLALSVVFTYTVGTAFAADANTADRHEAASSAAVAKEVEVSNKLIADKADQLIDKTFRYDDNGYLISAGDSNTLGTGDSAKGLLTKADLAAAKAAAVKAAQAKVTAAVDAQYADGGSLEDKANYTDAQIEAAVNAIHAAGVTAADDLTAASILGTVATGAYPMDTVVTVAFRDACKNTALTALKAYELKNYSNAAADEMAVAADAAGADPFATYQLVTVSGLAAGQYTPYAIVKAIVDKQTDAIDNQAAGVNTEAYIAAIKKYRDAAKLAEYYILGHKKTSSTDVYCPKIPTIADLQDDTSLDTAKANAIKKMKADLAAATITLSDVLQGQLDSLNQMAKPDAADLAEVKAAIAAFDAQIKAAETVYTALINYCTSASAANEIVKAAGVVGKDIAALAGVADYTDFKNNAKPLLEGYAKKETIVAAVKSEGELLALQKDVNGQPYYDAAALKSAVDQTVEYAYKGRYADTKAAIDALQALVGAVDASLLQAKYEYKEFINGNTVAQAVYTPKDSNGRTATKWNKADAAADAAASGNVTVLAKGAAAGGGYAVTASGMYDKAQKALLEALVADTEKAIDAAATVAEVQKAFAAANDKYADIASTKDHKAAWAGKVGAAYTNAKYDGDLEEYAKYFLAKIKAAGTDAQYPADLDSADKIMDKVVYPIIYSAYTTDELAGKVKEAKAAIDGIQTTKQLQEKADAVDALIAALKDTITLADKAAIVAAADAKAAYEELPGGPAIQKSTKLVAAAAAYEKLDAEAVQAAYDALKNKTITTADADAVKALREMFDAHADFVKDYNGTKTTLAVSDADVTALEDALSAAQVKAVKEALIKLPADPTYKDKAVVEAARAAYEALTTEQKLEVINQSYFKNLLVAEKAVEEGYNEYLKAGVQATKISIYSKAYKKYTKISWKKSLGFKVDGYEIYRSTKKNTGFKKIWTAKSTAKSVKNTKNRISGKRYYYYAKGFRMIDGEKVYTKKSITIYRTAK